MKAHADHGILDFATQIGRLMSDDKNLSRRDLLALGRPPLEIRFEELVEGGAGHVARVLQPARHP